VHVVEGSMEEVALDGTFDALLFMYTQDVLRSRASLRNIFAHARPGARVAVAGLKLFPWYLAAANVYLVAVSWRYFTTFDGLREPWSLLSEHVGDLRVRATHFGSGYIAHGHHGG
jgi:demethylmenaquinone methyltransferase/2-methoxy-6-polyprenyl-1,4-benzoquinol methylase